MKTCWAYILCAVALSACGSEPVTMPHGGLTGIFVVRTVDGLPLPAKANSASATEFTMLADTIRVYVDGFGTEVSVTSRPAVPGVATRSEAVQVSETGANTITIDYACSDTFVVQASCLATPHHRGSRTASGLVLDYSVLYRTPLVFTRIGPIID